MSQKNVSTNIEYEATFTNINVKETQEKIQKLGGKLLKPKFTQKRTVFNFPKGNELEGAFLRVRDEGDKITMTMKQMLKGEGIERQKEIELIVDSYDNAVAFLKSVGAQDKAVQETKRELWELDGVEIMLDWWPFLEPVIEIEGASELAVRQVAEKLGFDWSEAIFDTITHVYCKEYNITVDRVNNQTPKIVFDMENPFL